MVFSPWAKPAETHTHEDMMGPGISTRVAGFRCGVKPQLRAYLRATYRTQRTNATHTSRTVYVWQTRTTELHNQFKQFVNKPNERRRNTFTQSNSRAIITQRSSCEASALRTLRAGQYSAKTKWRNKSAIGFC